MSFEVKVIVFVIASAGLVWLSWPSLRNVLSHGFYRFFAFETIVILLNIDYWFYEPSSIHQVISWILLIISLFFVIHGFRLLHTAGKPGSKRKDSFLLSIEKTTELVTAGAYHYIRHPIYSSALYRCWGVFFKNLSWIGFSLAVITTFFLTMTAKREEIEDIRFFGDTYKSHMKKTKMFIPFVF